MTTLINWPRMYCGIFLQSKPVHPACSRASPYSPESTMFRGYHPGQKHPYTRHYETPVHHRPVHDQPVHPSRRPVHHFSAPYTAHVSPSSHRLHYPTMSLAGNSPLFTPNRLNYALPRPPKRPLVVLDLTIPETQPDPQPNPQPEYLVLQFVKSVLYLLLAWMMRLMESRGISARENSDKMIENESEEHSPVNLPKETEALIGPENETSEDVSFKDAPHAEHPSSPHSYSQVLPDDLSVMTMENNRTTNIYDSMFDIDSTDDLVGGLQYGTALLFNRRRLRGELTSNILRSDFRSQSRIEPSTYIADLFGDSLKMSSSATTRSPQESVADTLTPRDEYDIAISRFYAPAKPLPVPRFSLTDTILSTIPTTKVSELFKRERQAVQDLITKERTALRSSVAPLSDQQLAVVNSHWKNRNATPVVSAFSIDISSRDLLTLSDGLWLNDNVIDFYLSLVSESSDLVYCWTTHFFSTLKSKGYQGVARWAKRRKINVTEKKKVIVPINIMSTHWAMAVIDNEAKQIRYHDSLSSSGNRTAVELLALYMEKEAERLLVPPLEYQLMPNAKTPQQQNGYDCGVFTCTVAKYIARNLDLSFSQKDMKTIRRRMAYEIIEKSLIVDPSGPHL